MYNFARIRCINMRKQRKEKMIGFLQSERTNQQPGQNTNQIKKIGLLVEKTRNEKEIIGINHGRNKYADNQIYEKIFQTDNDAVFLAHKGQYLNRHKNNPKIYIPGQPRC